MVILGPAVAVAGMQIAAVILGYWGISLVITRLDSLDTLLPHTVRELSQLRLTICGLGQADIREFLSTSEL